MLYELSRIVEADPNLDDDQLRDAALLLATRQYIYGDDHGMRRSYDLIVRYRDYFSKLADAFGNELVVNSAELMVGWRMTRTPRFPMQLDVALTLLAMRLMFDEAIKDARQDERSRVYITARELFDLYEDRTGRKRPPTSTTGREIVKKLERHGLCRLGEDLDDRDFGIELRPALLYATPEASIAALEDLVRARRAEERDAYSDGAMALGDQEQEQN